MNTIPTSLPAATSTNPPDTIELTPEDKRFNELSQMAINGTYEPGVTAKDLAAAKKAVYMCHDYVDEDDYEPWPSGGESVLHEAAYSGHYPPDTTLELLAETKNAQSYTVLEHALLMYRDHGIPLPSCCTGPALARLERKCSFGETTWLHYAATGGFTTPDTTPALLINTVGDGWTALHAAAGSGNLIPGITIRMLKGAVTPVTCPRSANFSAFEAYKMNVDQALGYLSKGTRPLSKEIINSTKNLLQASLKSVPNLESRQEVRELAKLFQPIAPVETALWFATELAGHQQRLVDADKATVPAAEAPTTGQGEPLAPVGEKPKASTVEVTAENRKKDTDGTPPAEPSIETPPNPELVGQGGDGGKGDKGGEEFACPKCGGKMAIKTARQGKNKGHIFYGCAAWRDTKCSGTRDPQGQDTTRGH